MREVSDTHETYMYMIYKTHVKYKYVPIILRSKKQSLYWFEILPTPRIYNV